MADKEFAVQKILEIRAGREVGDMSPRTRRNPTINHDASTAYDLIDWKTDKVHEPVFTCKLDTSEIKDIINTPYPMKAYSTHTQSCERAVQEVAKASEAVYGEDRRDGWVRARIDHREIVPVFASKKDIMKLLN